MKSKEHNYQVQSPVLFLVFNRPSTTQRVFQAIREAQPAQLYIVADGPRQNKAGEAERCEEVRHIVSQVDWPCEVKKMFREENMGCGRGVPHGIDWFFLQVEEGIILEDDCLPSPDFFKFCDELLSKYREDTRVMQIGGNNFVPAIERPNHYSYHFSRHNYIWGWATWSRAWALYDRHMKQFDEVTQKHLLDHYFKSFDERDYFDYVFGKILEDIENPFTWDYQWEFSKMTQAGLTVVPATNLVINLGFGAEATHTFNQHDHILAMEHEKLDFPLQHPPFMMIDNKTEAKAFKLVFTTRWSRIKQRVKRYVPNLIFGLLCLISVI